MINRTASRVISSLILGSVALGAPVALAAGVGSRGDIDRRPPWERGYSDYEFKHPMKTTCSEFIETDTVYQPYIVSYLEGVAHEKYKKEVVVDEGYAPISVPSVVEACTMQPDKTVWDMVKTRVAAEK